MRWGFLLAGALALFSGGQAGAQDNAACDAACPVPCYFGYCSPAKANYDRALELCSEERLQAVTTLYPGTRSAVKAQAVLERLRARVTGRISATPNATGQPAPASICAAFIEDDGPCSKVAARPGYRCEVDNGVALLVQEATVGTTVAAPPSIGLQDITECDRLAAHPEDAQRPAGVAGVNFNQIDTTRAIAACRAEYGRQPQNPRIVYQLGRALLAAKRYTEAISYYNDSCSKGYGNGCASLGTMYEKGLGVAEDDLRAVTLYQNACDRGHAVGCTTLGRMFENGRGVAQDYFRAAALYRQGCDGGNALGCTNLGWAHANGRGVAQDYFRAAALYRQGCDGANARGCTNLGESYVTGRGVSKDFVRAVALLRQSCDDGDSNGCSGLGNAYRLGRGVTKDLGQARIFLTKGCDAGHQWGCDRLKELP